MASGGCLVQLFPATRQVSEIVLSPGWRVRTRSGDVASHPVAGRTMCSVKRALDIHWTGSPS